MNSGMCGQRGVEKERGEWRSVDIEKLRRKKRGVENGD